jgi:hypothetical protein
MVVLEPLEITIANFASPKPIEISVPNFPNKPELGSHTVTFGQKIYIEKSDFLEVCRVRLKFCSFKSYFCQGWKQKLPKINKNSSCRLASRRLRSTGERNKKRLGR